MTTVAAVHTLTTGQWRQNGYIVEGPDRRALIIDPGAEAERFLDLVDRRALSPVAILNTHAHYDHIGAVCTLVEAFKLPFFLHGDDRVLLRQANLYRGLFGASHSISVPPEFTDLRDFVGIGLSIGGFDVECLATPGHTKGGICFRIEEHLFTGDTLLPNGLGRADLPGGSETQLQASLQQLLGLPGKLTMYPGHGKVGPLAGAQALASSACLSV